MTRVIYAVVRHRDAIVRTAGVAGEAVQLIDEGELSAAVSEAPAELLARRRDVTAHMDVLDELMQDGAVLPFRFGTVVADDEEVRRMLADRADEYGALLAALDNHVQLTLHLTHDEEAVVPLVMAADPGLRGYVRSHASAGGLTERIAVGERVAEAVANVCAADQTAALDAFGQLAETVVVTAREPHDLVASLLVRRERLALVDAASEQVGRRIADRARFEVAGPMPPYSFVE